MGLDVFVFFFCVVFSHVNLSRFKELYQKSVKLFKIS